MPKTALLLSKNWGAWINRWRTFRRYKRSISYWEGRKPLKTKELSWILIKCWRWVEFLIKVLKIIRTSFPTAGNHNQHVQLPQKHIVHPNPNQRPFINPKPKKLDNPPVRKHQETRNQKYTPENNQNPLKAMSNSIASVLIKKVLIFRYMAKTITG